MGSQVAEIIGRKVATRPTTHNFGAARGKRFARTHSGTLVRKKIVKIDPEGQVISTT